MKNTTFQGPPNPTGCQHITHNIALVRSGAVKTYLQAVATIRTFLCPCSKCHPLRRYANDTDISLNKSLHREAEVSRMELKRAGLN